jgi:hypothetical protein
VSALSARKHIKSYWIGRVGEFLGCSAQSAIMLITICLVGWMTAQSFINGRFQWGGKMKKLIIILVIVACATISYAQELTSFQKLRQDSIDRMHYRIMNEPPCSIGISSAAIWTSRIYNDTPPSGIQWNVERPSYQPEWYDIRTGHYTVPPPGVVQSMPFPIYNMPRP